MTIDEAAQALNVGRTTIFKLIKDGDLRAIKIGRLRRIPIPAIEEYLDAAS